MSIKKEPSALLVVVAFAILYIVWGSTYYFIQLAITDIPPMLMGALRFLAAGILLLIWCIIRGDNVFDARLIRHAALTGFLLLFLGTGAVIWAEKTLPSSLVAVLIASQAIWLVIMDKRGWKDNFSSRSTVTGLIIGFAGIILLFSESASKTMAVVGGSAGLIGLGILMLGTISWTAGSVYSKYSSTGSPSVNASWQMLTAGGVFLIASFVNREWAGFKWSSVQSSSWMAVLYLVLMGSLAAYSAYVWLLKVKSVAQVGTHVYVNPVVAVLLGVFFAGETMSGLQFAGLGIVLTSVLLINLSKYRKAGSLA